MKTPRYPSLYQINTRVWLTSVSQALGRPATPGLGGDAALTRIRRRLRDRGLRLMLDFVPNHTAPDHPSVEEHPEYFMTGTESDLAQAPQNFTRLALRQSDRCWRSGAIRTSRAGPTRCPATPSNSRAPSGCAQLFPSSVSWHSTRGSSPR